MRLSFPLPDSLILKIFPPPPIPLLVRISPLVKERTAGVAFRFGPAEFWFFSCPSSRFHTSPPPAVAGWGSGVVVSFLVDQDPILHAWVSRDLAFPSRPRGFRTHIDTSGVPAPTPGGGAEVTSQKTCTFLRTNVTQLSKGPAAAPFQKPRPPSGRVLPDLFGADLPKVMPYWFCTNRVHL